MRIPHWLLVAALACGALLTACSPSKADIEEQSKKLTQQIIDENLVMKSLDMVVNRVDAIQEVGNKYKGFADVSMDGQHYRAALSILSDGDKILVTPEDGAFGFALEKAVAKAAALVDHATQRNDRKSILVKGVSFEIKENETYRVIMMEDDPGLDFCGSGWKVAILKNFEWSSEKNRRIDMPAACWNSEAGTTTVKYFDLTAMAQDSIKQFSFSDSLAESMMYDIASGALSSPSK